MASNYETRFQVNRFQNNRFQILSPEGGAVVGYTGGNFSRGRWHNLLAERAAQREAERQRKLAAKAKRKAERLAREAAEREARRLAREAAKNEGAALVGALSLAHGAAASRGLDHLREIAQLAAAQAQVGHVAPHVDQDEEEAIALLLLGMEHR